MGLLSYNSALSQSDLAFGRIAGRSEGNKFGYSAGLGTAIQIGTPSTWVDLWVYGGQRTAPSGTFTPYFASSSSADTSKEITFTYLDATGLEKSVTVTTDASDGQTPVSLGVTATDVARGRVTGSSDIAGNVAIASANNFTAGVPDNQSEVLAAVDAGDNTTQVAAGRVPSNQRRRITHINSYILRDSGNNGSVIAVFQTKAPGEVWRTRTNIFVTNGAPFSEEQEDLILEPSTDFRIRIKDVSDTATYVSARIRFEDLEV